MISDVELSRAVNALATTLRDQRPPRLDADRCQAIVTGALGGERKAVIRRTGDDSAVLAGLDGCELARIERRDGAWTAYRTVDATDSRWAVPQPEAGGTGSGGAR